MRIFVLILLLVCFPFAGMAEDAAPKPATAKETKEQPAKTVRAGKEAPANKAAPKKTSAKKKRRLQDSPECQKLADAVRDGIDKLGRCWKDADCTAVSLGCPWQMAPCHQTVISLAEPEKNVELANRIRAFATTCIVPDKPYEAACKEFNEKVESSHCQTLYTACVSGKCMNQMDIILQDPDIGMKIEKGSIVPDDILKKKR